MSDEHDQELSLQEEQARTQLAEMEALFASMDAMMADLQESLASGILEETQRLALMQTQREAWRRDHSHFLQTPLVISNERTQISDYLEMVFSPVADLAFATGKGRIMVAKEPLEAGDVILVEPCLVKAVQEVDGGGSPAADALGGLYKDWVLAQALGELPAPALTLFRELTNAHESSAAALIEVLATLRSEGVDAAAGHSLEEIAAWMGICASNAFQRKAEDGTVTQHIFVGSAMLSHSCAPNASYEIEDGWSYMQASEAIPAGAEITNSYIDRYQPTDARRSLLERSYGFVCECPRCVE